MASTGIYRDIQKRTGGDIYIGVVGPGSNGQIDIYQTVHGPYGSSED